MSLRLHIVRIDGAMRGECGVCEADVVSRYFDNDLQAPVCAKCKDAVKMAECLLITTHGISHPEV